MRLKVKEDIRDGKNLKNNLPSSNTMYPVAGNEDIVYMKNLPIAKDERILIGDFTYCDGIFKVSYHYSNDKLIIGKFCQIAKCVEFIMNGANHKMDCVSTFPFYMFDKWTERLDFFSSFPYKGDTIIGNDVWIGTGATIMPGVEIGDGAIVGAKSVVTGYVEPYTIIAGNPAREIRKRFDNELICLLQEFKWWDLPIEEINGIVPILRDNNLERVKEFIKGKLNE